MKIRKSAYICRSSEKTAASFRAQEQRQVTMFVDNAR